MVLMLGIASTLAACGSSPSSGGVYASMVAGGFEADCAQSAPTPALQQQLNRLCACTSARISSSDIAIGDGHELVNAKVHRAMRECEREVYSDVR